MGGLLGALAWIAGAAVQLQQAQLWPQGVDLALCAAGVVLLLPAWRWRPARWPCVAAACFVLALGSTGWRAHERLAQVLPAALEGRDLVVTGLVASLPQANLSGVRFNFEVEAATHDGQPVALPRRIVLGWYRGFDADAMLAAPGQEIRAGQRWRLTVRLRQPHGTLNPHGFDLELWLFEQGIRASGYVRATATTDHRLLEDAAAFPVQRARQRIRDAIEQHLSDPVSAGVIAALVVGDQAAIDRTEWDLFRITGVAHLMSISGLHVTMFAWLAGALVARLWRLHPRLMLALPAPGAGRWGGLLCAAAYAVLAGWGVPAQRTVWMIATVVVLRSLGWRWPASHVLAAAAVVVCLVDPWALLQPGFWLSFVAVALLLGSEPAHRPQPTAAGWWRRAAAILRSGLHTQVVATVGLAPLTLVFFQQVSLVGFVANLVAVPLVTLIITPLALAGVLLPALWTLCSSLVQALLASLAALAQAPLAVWQAAAAPAWAMAAGMLGGAVAVMPLPWRLRLLALPLMLPLLHPPLPRPPAGQFEAVVLDVGQGTAVLVRTRHHLLVYDAGPQYSPEADAGQRVLLPLLRARGEDRIDLLMLSHRDSDHVGGADTLLAHARVAALSSSLEPAHVLLGGNTPHQPCAAGQAWDWDGVRFSVLHPAPGEAGTLARPNTLSCVLRVQAAGGRSLLLTGDIEAGQEARLVQGAGEALRSEVLVVPHHGSRTSSIAAFIEAVAPRVAVVQAAYRSRFGHPAPDVVARYEARGIEVVRSDRCGAWTWRSEGSASCERRTAARYWHHRVLGLAP